MLRYMGMLRTAAAATALLLASACTTSADKKPAVAAPTDQRTCPTPVEDPAGQPATPNVVLYAANRSPMEQTLTLRVGTREVFTERLPADPVGCFLDPLVVRKLVLPTGAVSLEADTGSQRQTVQFTVGRLPKYVTVQVQEGFPLSVKVTDTAPAFG